MCHFRGDEIKNPWELGVCSSNDINHAIFEAGVQAAKKIILKKLAKVPRKITTNTKYYKGSCRKVYDEFWRLIVERGGKLSKAAVMRELHDYAFLLYAVPKVYCELSEGRISKPNTLPEVVISEIEDVINDAVLEAIKHEKEDLKDEIVSRIEDLFKNNSSITITKEQAKQTFVSIF